MIRRVAFVVDKRNWAYDNVATHIRRLIEQHYSVSIDILYIEDFSDERRFVAHLLNRRYDLIHFFWWKYLNLVLQHCISAGARAEFERAFCGTAVSVSVASMTNKLALDASGLTSENHIFRFIDGYCTVSKRFYDQCADQLLLPNPISVLYDRTDMIVALADGPRQYRRRSSEAPLNLIWAGDSAHGSWFGHEDLKGVNIIHSAIKQAAAAGCPINYTEFDSRQRHTPQEEVGEAMLSGDVYICAAQQEGTPLPVVEAMAAGCAVITTDVGIVREHFPEEQHELIVAREINAFVDAFLRCACDPGWTEKIGDLNRKAVRQFGNRPLHDEWMQFFSKVFERSRIASRPQEKMKIISGVCPSLLGARINRLRRLVRRSPVATALARKMYPLAKPMLAMLDGGVAGSPRLQSLEVFRDSLAANANQVGTLAIYCPRWPGITASTTAMFDHKLPIPLSASQHPDMVTPAEVNEYVDILQTISPRRLIVSGGNKCHRDIAVGFKSACPQARIELIWRGSQLEWIAEKRQRDQFLMWVREYQAGTIDKIWTVKRGLDSLLKAQGIETELFENFHPQERRSPKRLNAGTPIKIGLWPVNDNWRKNLISQFLAFAADERVLVHHAMEDSRLLSLVDTFHVPHIKVGDAPLPRSEALSWMGAVDLNLYVSLSECSPNVPLESISLGVPVVVGPTTTFFNDEPFLYDRLVVPSPEDMSSIRTTVDRVLSEYDAIADAVITFGRKRDISFAEMRKRLNACE